LANIRDGAAEAGVSASTVSRVINGQGNVRARTRERVLKAVAKLGYVPSANARALKGKPTPAIALVISDVTNPCFAALTRGVEDVAQDHGYSLVLGNADSGRDKLLRYVDRAMAAGVRGIIVAPTARARADLCRLVRQGVALVVVDWRYHLEGADNVYADSIAAAQCLVEHMVSCGHRRIAMVTGPRGDATAEDRALGFRQALVAAGIEPEDKLLRFADYSVAAGHRAARQLLAARPRPTGIIAANNRIAAGVFQAVQALGARVPEDVSLAAVDEAPFEPALATSLTVYVQPDYDIGKTAAELLFERLKGIRGEDSRREVVLQGHLVVRSSVARLPAGERSVACIETRVATGKEVQHR